jgi:hypothetical protein
MGELSIRWTGDDDREIEVGDEYDDTAEAEPTVAESVTEADIRALAESDVPAPRAAGDDAS